MLLISFSVLQEEGGKMQRRSFIYLLLGYFAPRVVQASRNASLAGSPSSQKRQNQMADTDGLSRISDDQELEKFKRLKLLVPIPEEIIVDGRLDRKFHFVRPWTANFLMEINREFMREFKHPIQVNSAVRTRVYQEALRKINGNAATSDGDEASSHLTGATIDIAKLKMREVEQWWMRRRLLYLEQRGFIEATEERHQAVFHVMVFKRWAYPKSTEE
jgi:hypothetical protein